MRNKNVTTKKYYVILVTYFNDPEQMIPTHRNPDSFAAEIME